MLRDSRDIPRLIHKEPSSVYGVSFPDVPGVTAAADTIDEVMERAGDPASTREMADAIVAAVPIKALAEAA